MNVIICIKKTNKKQKSKATHWASLFIDKNTAIYFDSFGIKYIPQEVLSKIKDKSFKHNTFRIQNDDSIMCKFYCITFIEYMPEGKICYIIPIYFLWMTIKGMTI